MKTNVDFNASSGLTFVGRSPYGHGSPSVVYKHVVKPTAIRDVQRVTLAELVAAKAASTEALLADLCVRLTVWGVETSEAADYLASVDQQMFRGVLFASAGRGAGFASNLLLFQLQIKLGVTFSSQVL